MPDEARAHRPCFPQHPQHRTAPSAGRTSRLPTKGATMALSNLSLEPSAAKKGPDCTVCQALTELPPDKAELILGALRNPRWRYTEIVNEVASDQDLPEWVRNIADGTYARHAKGSCFLMRQRGEKLR